MAKRKRKKRRPRTGPAPRPSAATETAGSAPEPPKRRTADDPPPPPWGSFPLSEIVVLIALVLLVAGFFVGPPRGAIMLGTGLVLGSLAGLELSGREHFAGYRSHTVLLAGAVGVATLIALLTLTKINALVCVGAAAIAFGVSAYALAAAFRTRSGGSLYKVKR